MGPSLIGMGPIGSARPGRLDAGRFGLDASGERGEYQTDKRASYRGAKRDR